MYESHITSQRYKDFFTELNQDDTEHKVSYFNFNQKFKIRNPVILDFELKLKYICSISLAGTN